MAVFAVLWGAMDGCVVHNFSVVAASSHCSRPGCGAGFLYCLSKSLGLCLCEVVCDDLGEFARRSG
jgi:hypothetical protein